MIAAMAPAFRIADVQVVISRREVKAAPETELQSHDDWMRSFRIDSNAPSERRQKRSKEWAFDSERLLRHRNRLYIPEDNAIREELISRCHDDSLSGLRGAAKTHELLARKYHWNESLKEVTEYVKICDICQRTMSRRHRPYGEFNSLFVAIKP